MLNKVLEMSSQLPYRVGKIHVLVQTNGPPGDFVHTLGRRGEGGGGGAGVGGGGGEAAGLMVIIDGQDVKGCK